MSSGGLFDSQINELRGVEFQQDELNLDQLSRALMALRCDGAGWTFVKLIPGAVHRWSCVLRKFFRGKPPGRLLFTTDAMAAGAPTSRSLLGAVFVEVRADRVARQPGVGGFAGLTLTLAEGACRTASFLGLQEAEAARLWRASGVA